MKKLINISLFIALLASLSYGQNESLTNVSVFDMVKAGWSDELIISKIKTSETDFVTAIDVLNFLKKDGVSDKVIMAMIQRQQEVNNKKQDTQAAANANFQPQTEYGDIAEIAVMRKVFVQTENIKAREIIVKIINKDSNLQITSTPGEAEFAIVFAARVEATGQSFTGNQIVQDGNVIGEMLVIIPGKADRRNNRVIWSGQKVQVYKENFSWNTDPATSTIERFLKALKKVQK